MPVDFFAVPCVNPAGNCPPNLIQCLAPIAPNPFGITDANGGTGVPARVDTVNQNIWDLKIENNASINVTFKAVDWCVPIFRTGIYSLDDDNRTSNQFSSDNIDSSGGGLIKRCEGFLYFDNKMLFIEIKNRAGGRGWLKDAREKFEETILSFREHHPNMANQVIEPVLSNPAFAKSHQNEMVQKRILKDKVGLEFKRQSSYIIS